MAGCGNSRDETISIMQILFSLETSNCKLCEVKAGHQAPGWCIVWWPCIRASWPNTNTTTNPTLRLGWGKVAIRFSTKAINTTKWWAVQWPHLCGSYHIILVLMILHFDRWGSAFRGWVSKWVAVVQTVEDSSREVFHGSGQRSHTLYWNTTLPHCTIIRY